MILAGMLNYDSDLLECDLAQTYNIYDYRELPVSKVALFSAHLNDDSRIKLKMSNAKQSLDTLLLSSIVDRLSYLVWAKTEDGRKGRNRPLSITSKLLNITEENDIIAFDTGEDFEVMKNKILGKEVI